MLSAATNNSEKEQDNVTPISWHMDRALKVAFDKARSQKIHQGSKDLVEGYTLLPAGPIDMEKVVTAYQRSPAPGYHIKSVQVIYNPDLNIAFSTEISLLNKRHGKLAFAPKWRAKSDLQAGSTNIATQWRHSTHATLEAMARPHKDPEHPYVTLVPMWHATKQEVLSSIFDVGFANLAEIDPGFFGKGIYSAGEAKYSWTVYGKMFEKPALLMNWVSTYSAYPVIHGDQLMAGANVGNYDAHFVPVYPQDPSNPNEINFFPCKFGQDYTYTELVVFNARQCLPRYLVELQSDVSQSLPDITVEQAAKDLLLQLVLNGNTALLRAAARGRLDVVQWLLVNGSTLAERNDNGMSALLCASNNGHLSTVQWLLANGATLSEKDNIGNTALLLAAYNGHLSTVQWSLANSATLAERNEDGATALLLAVSGGHLDVVKWLLTHGATLTDRNQYGNTALLLATINGHLSTVQWLLAQGGTPSEKNQFGNTALLIAAGDGHLEIIQYLLMHGSILVERNNAGTTALLMAACYGHLDTVKWLLAHGATLAEKNKSDGTALLNAAANGHIDTVQWLLAHGAALTEKDKNGQTALLYAAYYGQLETVQWLLMHGSTLTEKDKDGMTALLMAAKNGKLETVQWLLSNGATLAEKNQHGNTALLMAAKNGKLETVQWLLENGARLTEKNNSGDTAMMLAASYGHFELVDCMRFLLAYKVIPAESNQHASATPPAGGGGVASSQRLFRPVPAAIAPEAKPIKNKESCCIF